MPQSLIDPEIATNLELWEESLRMPECTHRTMRLAAVVYAQHGSRIDEFACPICGTRNLWLADLKEEDVTVIPRGGASGAGRMPRPDSPKPAPRRHQTGGTGLSFHGAYPKLQDALRRCRATYKEALTAKITYGEEDERTIKAYALMRSVRTSYIADCRAARERPGPSGGAQPGKIRAALAKEKR